MNVDSSSIVSTKTKIHQSVNIGPFCIIGDDVEIDEGTNILSHAVIKGPTKIGKNNVIYQFSSIGEDTPDKKYKGEDTQLIIGDNNIFREGVTVHRGTIQDKGITKIGNSNLFMAYTHIAHDCVIEDNCILSNAASLAGHVRLESNVSLGGFTLVHQFCHIGKYAFSGLGTVISQDVTPYTLIAGNHAKAYKINSEGLRRKKFDSATIKDLERCFKIFIKSSKPMNKRLAIFKDLSIKCPHVNSFVDFILDSKRGITR